LDDSGMHTRQSSIHSEKCQGSHRYSYFSWWWAHSRPKHVKKRNKHTKKNCAQSWLYLQSTSVLHEGEFNDFLACLSVRLKHYAGVIIT
jgi:hypothetical protein